MRKQGRVSGRKVMVGSLGPDGWETRPAEMIVNTRSSRLINVGKAVKRVQELADHDLYRGRAHADPFLTHLSGFSNTRGRHPSGGG